MLPKRNRYTIQCIGLIAGEYRYGIAIAQSGAMHFIFRAALDQSRGNETGMQVKDIFYTQDGPHDVAEVERAKTFLAQR